MRLSTRLRELLDHVLQDVGRRLRPAFWGDVQTLELLPEMLGLQNCGGLITMYSLATSPSLQQSLILKLHLYSEILQVLSFIRILI